MRWRMAGLSTAMFFLLLFVTTAHPVWSQNSGMRVSINLPSHTLTVYEYGQVKREYPVAVGAITNKTPIGSAVVINRVKDPTYYPPNWGTLGLEPVPPGPDNPVGSIWIGLDWPGYGIHGTNSPASIGRTVSLGCVRMHNQHVEELYQMVAVGTPVDFVYQVVELGSLHDPWPSLTVHADIYNRQPDYFQEAAQLLYPLGIWDQIDEDALRKLVESGQVGTFQVPRRSTIVEYTL